MVWDLANKAKAANRQGFFRSKDGLAEKPNRQLPATTDTSPTRPPRLLHGTGSPQQNNNMTNSVAAEGLGAGGSPPRGDVSVRVNPITGEAVAFPARQNERPQPHQQQQQLPFPAANQRELAAVGPPSSVPANAFAQSPSSSSNWGLVGNNHDRPISLIHQPLAGFNNGMSPNRQQQQQAAVAPPGQYTPSPSPQQAGWGYGALPALALQPQHQQHSILGSASVGPPATLHERREREKERGAVTEKITGARTWSHDEHLTKIALSQGQANGANAAVVGRAPPQQQQQQQRPREASLTQLGSRAAPDPLPAGYDPNAALNASIGYSASSSAGIVSGGGGGGGGGAGLPTHLPPLQLHIQQQQQLPHHTAETDSQNALGPTPRAAPVASFVQISPSPADDLVRLVMSNYQEAQRSYLQVA